MKTILKNTAKLSDDLLANSPDIPWDKVRGLRHRIAKTTKTRKPVGQTRLKIKITNASKVFNISINNALLAL